MLYYTYDVMKKKGYGPLIAGPVSAICSWSLFYPLDVLRTRLQTMPKEEMRSGRKQSAVVRQFFKQPFRKWFPGFGITMIRTVPRFAVTFFVLESLS